MIPLVLVAALSGAQGGEICPYANSSRMLPGVDHMLTTFRLLDPMGSSKPRVFDLPEGLDTQHSFQAVSFIPQKFYVPEGFLVTEDLNCHLVPKTRII